MKRIGPLRNSLLYLNTKMLEQSIRSAIIPKTLGSACKFLYSFHKLPDFVVQVKSPTQQFPATIPLG